MHHVTFRFTTECELTFAGESYEEAYLRFTDFQRGQDISADSVQLMACPPETAAVYFKLEGDEEFHEIQHFKGNFEHDMGPFMPNADNPRDVLSRH